VRVVFSSCIYNRLLCRKREGEEKREERESLNTKEKRKEQGDLA
jgi:hypothetical protein